MNLVPARATAIVAALVCAWTMPAIDACRRCDVLIHEVHTAAWLAARPEAGGAPPRTFRRFSDAGHFVIGRDLDVY